jgi:hypothetical protein
MAETRPPAPRPCVSCPYRTDVPSGVWAADEYEKLLAYDRPTFEQPIAVFLCHQQDGRACAGWAGCHDGDHLLALRFAGRDGLSPEVADAIRDYRSPIPLHPSGAAAAARGRAELETPGPAAVQLQKKLLRQRAAATETNPGGGA